MPEGTRHKRRPTEQCARSAFNFLNIFLAATAGLRTLTYPSGQAGHFIPFIGKTARLLARNHLLKQPATFFEIENVVEVFFDVPAGSRISRGKGQ